MRLILTTTLVGTLMLSVPGLTAEALAHGGRYRGPVGEIPPDSREPHDPPPPGSGGGPTTPGGEPTGPGTGGNPLGPGTGGDGPSNGGTSGTGPTSSGGPIGPGTGNGSVKGRTQKGPGFEDWVFWWNFNKDGILQVKSLVKARERSTGTGGSLHAFGGSGAQKGEGVRPATEASIKGQIVPALRKMLEDDDLNFDIQSAAGLALAKIGDQSIVGRLKEQSLDQRKKGHWNTVVVESAALAFGLLQHDSAEVREHLIDLVGDGRRDASFVRPFAAVSLGLLGTEKDVDGKVVAALLDVIARDEPRGEVRPACILALGLLGDDALVPQLLHIVETGKLDRRGAADLGKIEQAFAVTALGQIGVPGTADDELAVVDALTRIVNPKRSYSTQLRRSAVVALGQITPQCDESVQVKIVRTLQSVAMRGKDTSECNFAMIALGRIGASKGLPEKTRETTVGSLRYLLEKARPTTTKRPFAALGLGLVARSMVLSGGAAPEEEIRKPLRETFDEARNPRERGAYAIASGLAGDKLAVKALQEVYMDQGAEGRLRGDRALALGMIGDASSRELIRGVLADEEQTNRDLRIQTAAAAGLLGDGGAVTPLVNLLEKETSQYVLGSVSLALGQMGDDRAIAPLLAIAQGASLYPDLTRALAVVALGQIGDRRDAPVLSRVSTDINYRAQTNSIGELLSIL